MTAPQNISPGSAISLIARADKYLNTGSGEYASDIMRDMAEFIRRLPATAQPSPIARSSAATAAPSLPDRERMAEILYTAAHKGLRNCWKWSDADLDHEHPTSRGYWYKIADGALAELSGGVAQPSEQRRIDDAKRITSAVLNTMNKGGDNLAIYEAVWGALVPSTDQQR